MITGLQKKVMSLERRLQENLSEDEHLQELLAEVNSSLLTAAVVRRELVT